MPERTHPADVLFRHRLDVVELSHGSGWDVLLTRLAAVPQPWLFIGLALGFGAIAYFASGDNLVHGIGGGLLFGAAISLWLRLREHLWR
jgi:hypothetical protein